MTVGGSVGDEPDRLDEAAAPICGPGCACSVGNEFGKAQARRDLSQYRRRGADRTTRWLVDGLAAGGVKGMSVLDIGAGIGVVHLELLAAGATTAVDVDGSPAYVEVARDEARRAGRSDAIRYAVGDFVELAASIEPADVVAMDRVVCCYPDVDALVRLSVARARRRYGLVYPRDSAWIRFTGRAVNAAMRLIRRPFRFWIHPSAQVDAIVRAAGFVPTLDRRTLFWKVVVYERG